MVWIMTEEPDKEVELKLAAVHNLFQAGFINGTQALLLSNEFYLDSYSYRDHLSQIAQSYRFDYYKNTGDHLLGLDEERRLALDIFNKLWGE